MGTTKPGDRQQAEIIGLGLADCLARVQSLAERDLPTLIVGDTGTGKELLSHAYSRAWCARAGKELSATVNCTGFTEELLRAELFGYVKGAFTGATQNRNGLIKAHDLICLDELGDAGSAFQAQLLRVVEYGEYLPVGAQKIRRSAVRFIASTNHSRGIRPDLAQRFHHVYVPPLAMRGEDLVALVEAYGAERGVRWVRARFAEWAAGYAWPGNVRELKRYMEEATFTGVLDVPEVPLREMPEVLYRSLSRMKVKGLATLALADFGKAFRGHYSPTAARNELTHMLVHDRKKTKKGLLAQIVQALEQIGNEPILNRMLDDRIRDPSWSPVGGRLQYLAGRESPGADTQPKNPEKERAIAVLRDLGSVRQYAEQEGFTGDRAANKRLRALGIDPQETLKGYVKRRRLVVSKEHRPATG